MRRLNLTFFATSLGMAALGTPWVASSQCTTDSNGVTTCTGTITTPQTIDRGTGREDVTLVSGASLTTSTDDQSSIRVRGFDSTTVNDGSIRYTGENNDFDRPGNAAVLLESGVVPAGADTTGSAVTFTNNGSIVTTGTNLVGTGGVQAVSGVGDVNIRNAANGTITSTNFGMAGESLQTGGSATAINDGGITTVNRGLVASARDEGTATTINTGTINAGDGLFSNVSGDNGTIVGTNTGTVEADNPFGFGILGNSFGTGNTVDLQNTGSISVTGVNSTGIGAFAGEDTDVLVRNNMGGSIAVGGDNGFGLVVERTERFAVTLTDTVTVHNAGAITSTGSNVTGIRVQTTTGTVSVENAASGGIDVSGTGISVYSEVGDVSIDNAGSIRSDGPAIRVETFDTVGQFIDNSGLIQSESGTAIDSVGDGPTQFGLVNSGMIEGDIQTSGSTDVLQMTGSVLGDIRLGAGNDEVQLSGGAAVTGDIDGGADFDQIIFDGTTGFTYSDALTGFEQITVSRGDIVLNQASIAGNSTFSIDQDGVVAIGGGTTTTDSGVFSNNGRLLIDPGSELSITNGNFVAASGSTTAFGVDASAGLLTAGGDITFQQGSLLEIDVRDQEQVFDGAIYDVAVAGGQLTNDADEVTDNSALFDFEASVIDGDTLRILAEQALMLAEAATPGDGNAQSVAQALQGLIDSGTPQGLAVSTGLAQASDEPALARAIGTFKLDSSNLAQYGLIDVARDVLQANLSGYSSDVERSKVWAAFVAGDSQLDTDGFRSGFDATRRTWVTGIDLSPGRGVTTYGLGVAFSSTDGNEENPDRRYSLDSSGRSILAYLSRRVGASNWDFSLGYATHELDSDRQSPVTQDVARANFDASGLLGSAQWQHMWRAGSAWQISPRITVSMVRFDVDDYQESGSDADARVQTADAESTRADLGLSFGSLIDSTAVGTWHLGVDGALSYELTPVDDQYESSYSGGQGFTTMTNQRDDFAVNVAAWANYRVSENVRLGMSYAGELSGNYQRHAGQLLATLLF